MRKLATAPCKWCGKPTPMLGTKECDAHWELRSRIEREPDMAERILFEVKSLEARNVSI